MVDRTSNTIFYTKGMPGIIWFKTNASNGDTFLIPHGVAEEAFGSSSGDNDAIATFTALGSKVTISLIDDAGSAVSADADIIGNVILKTQ